MVKDCPTGTALFEILTAQMHLRIKAGDDLDKALSPFQHKERLAPFNKVETDWEDAMDAYRRHKSVCGVCSNQLWQPPNFPTASQVVGTSNPVGGRRDE